MLTLAVGVGRSIQLSDIRSAMILKTQLSWLGEWLRNWKHFWGIEHKTWPFFVSGNLEIKIFGSLQLGFHFCCNSFKSSIFLERKKKCAMFLPYLCIFIFKAAMLHAVCGVWGVYVLVCFFVVVVVVFYFLGGDVLLVRWIVTVLQKRWSRGLSLNIQP